MAGFFMVGRCIVGCCNVIHSPGREGTTFFGIKGVQFFGIELKPVGRVSADANLKYGLLLLDLKLYGGRHYG